MLFHWLWCIKTILDRLPDVQQIAGTSTLGREMLVRTLRTGIGTTIVIDRPRGEDDSGTEIAIARDIDRRIAVAVVVHAADSLVSGRRAGKLWWKDFLWI